jgi:hypothetical protein
MLKKFALLASLSALTFVSACQDDGRVIRPKDLKPGGVFVAHSNGCDKGCDEIGRGDLIQSVDGNAAKNTADLAALTDGQPHKVSVLKKGADAPVEIEVVAQPSQEIPPLKDAPPFWTAGAEALNKAPEFARKRLFGHASPQILLVNSDGGLINGRDLHGKARFVVFFDWQTRTGQANAATFLKTLQKAQGDLAAKGVEIVFAQIKFPGRDRPPMNDSDLRKFHTDHQLTKAEGGPAPFLPLYHYPNSTEDQAARRLGLEGATTYIEYLSSDPAIVLLDKNGMIRWHSEGVVDDPEQKNPDPANYTIIKAIMFAQNELQEGV